MDNTEINFEYYSLLTPPEGYTLSKAIGTTYSLDLTTALSVPLAFHFRNGINPESIKDPLALFLSLKGTASKIDIFCQLGNISSKVSDNKLYRFIENSINEIYLDNGKSFHPKIWIIRFEKESAPAIYKIINLSRNLTNDSSWDMVIALEGEVKDKGTIVDSRTNQPLIDFINFLYHQKGKIAPVEFLKDLGKVCFRPLNDNFYKSIEFLPLGIGKSSKTFDFIYNNLEDEPYDHIVIVSPFVTQGVLDNVVRNSNKLTLISRLKTLEDLDQNKLASIDCRYINEKIVDGGAIPLDEEISLEFASKENIAFPDKKVPAYDLHAKVYLLKQGGSFQLFLGSANSSFNAFNGNIEFMVCVEGDRRNSGELFIETYFTPSNDFLVEYIADPTKQKDEIDTREHILDKYLSDICFQLSKSKCICIMQDANIYSVQIRFNSLNNDDGLESVLRPISVNTINQKLLSSIVEFSNISLVDLSTLFVLTVIDNLTGTNKSTILKLNIDDLPENREEAVVRSLIKNKSDLFQLLRWLLSEDIVEAMLEGSIDNSLIEGGAKWNFVNDDEYAIFEKMMLASSRNPSKLKDVKSIIDYLENNKLSDSDVDIDFINFISFWDKFKFSINK